MSRFSAALLACVLFSACAAHEYRVEEEEIVLLLRASNAAQVRLFCSCDGVQPKSAEKKWGRWEVRIAADRAFTYFYTIDGNSYVPDCPAREKDDFGSENCIVDPSL